MPVPVGVTFSYTLINPPGIDPYLRLISMSGTFPSNTDLVLDEDNYPTPLDPLYPIKDISNNAVFSGQTNLRSITMNNLRSISSDGILSGCTGLQSVSFGNLTILNGKQTFMNCISLTDFGNVNLGGVITGYPESTFKNCRFTSVTLSTDITTLDNFVFQDNSALESFTGTGLTSIGEQVFANCTSLTDFTNVNLGTSITAYTVSLFSNCRFVDIICPSHVTTLQGAAFNNNTSLQSFYGPSITNLAGFGIFANCSSLTDFTRITLGGSLAEYPISTFSGCGFVDVTLPSNITTLGDNAFSNNTSLQSFTAPNLQNIGNGIFINCTSLTDFTKVNLGTNINSYTDGLFYGCGFLNVNIPTNVFSLGDSTFRNCAQLESVWGPFIFYFGADVFKGCSSLQTCMLGSVSVSPQNSISNGAFDSCTNLRNLYLNPVKTGLTVGTNPLAGCTSLEYVFVPNNSEWTMGDTISWGNPGSVTVHKVALPTASLLPYTTTKSSAILNATSTTPDMPTGYTVPFYDYEWWKNGSQIANTSYLTIQSSINEDYYYRSRDPLYQQDIGYGTATANVLVGLNYVQFL